MNEVKAKLALTDLQWNILQHRLDISDCIAEVLVEEFGWHAEDVEDVTRLLNNGRLCEAEAVNKRISDEVLAEALEGSTWLGGIVGEYGSDSSKAHSHYRSMISLGEKIERYIGREVEVPIC